MELKELRNGIDRIDAEVLKLLNERMELALRSRRLKKEVTDEERENEVKEKYSKNTQGQLIGKQFTGALLESVVAESKRLQGEDYLLVGFQGEHGAYGEIAAASVAEKSVAIPCLEFNDVFESVKNKSLDVGVVPVENSLEGSVNAVNDLLISQEGLHVVGEINVAVHHCLLTLPDTDYRDIKVVYSHPQALGQCRGFIARNHLEARPYYDTAGSAQMLAKDRPKAAAVIASKLCAGLYGLEILKENIEDHQSNKTRFLIISRDKPSGGNKCSIAFSTKHKAGALYSVLKIFAEKNINLTRIESRPIRTGEANTFAFLLDFLGTENTAEEVITSMKEHTEWTRLLGCYKEEKA